MGIPLLESRPKFQMRNMTAKEACGNQKVVYFPRIVKEVDVLSILRSNNHNGFPVIDHSRNGETLVIGLILQSHLLVLLQSKVDFQHSPVPCETGPLPIRHNLAEFVKPVSSKGIGINDIHLTPDDLEMYIDLAPFLNPSPYVVPEDTSLTKVYNLFCQLGLRHILVIPHASRVVGMITTYKEGFVIEDNEESAGVREDLHKDRILFWKKTDAKQPLLVFKILENKAWKSLDSPRKSQLQAAGELHSKSGKK